MPIVIKSIGHRTTTAAIYALRRNIERNDVMIIEMPRVHHYTTYRGSKRMYACIHILLFFDYIHTHTHINSHHLLSIVSLDFHLEKKSNNSNLFFLHLPHQSSLVLMQKRKTQIPNDIINKIRISITKEGHEKRKNQDR